LLCSSFQNFKQRLRRFGLKFWYLYPKTHSSVTSLMIS
jgi:hypothetical protein